MSSGAQAGTSCLLCNASCASTRNSVQIFNKEIKTLTDEPILEAINKTIDSNIDPDTAHSQVICKRCYKLIGEAKEMQNRLSQIKDEITTNYNTSLTKRQSGEHENEPGTSKDVNGTVVVVENNKENELPRKILDIPSSDDDSSQVILGKNQLQTMEDIEMELEKMHGGISQSPIRVAPKIVKSEGNKTTTYSFNSVDLIDSGALDHSSDSDYEPNQSVYTQRSTNTDVKVKVEPSTSSGDPAAAGAAPNILRKKATPPASEVKVKEELNNVAVVARSDTTFTCLLCTGKTEGTTVGCDVRAITAHMRTVHDVRVYICDVCGQDFRKRNELSAHLDEHVAAEDGDFQCEVCNRIFNNLRLFRIHRRMHYPQNKAWPCDICNKKYSSRNLLDEHYNTHTGVRPHVCGQCGKDFASKYTFKAHERTHEVRPRPYACVHCPKTFLSQQNLLQHERTHTGLKEYSCHLCHKRFGSAHNLEVHSIVHTGYRPFSCDICHKSFARKAEIRDHERTHTGERPYQCETCGATFSQRSNLQSHIRATHLDDKRYVCANCGKGFKRRRLLDYHMKAAHTGERPFKCSVCDATFVYPEHFKKHRRIHTGEKPFSCEVCGKAFNSRDNRNAHRFVHSDKKPYECLVCGAGYMRKPLLYQHMQAQGHLNDTIVVNQPRLTTDEEAEEQFVTVHTKGEMAFVDPSKMSDTMEEDSVLTEDSKLYINDQIMASSSPTQEQDQSESDGGYETVEHIIIDGQQLRFATEDEEEEDMDTITSETLAESETQLIDTPDGPIQLVRVRIPNDNGEEEEAWIKIVPE